MKLWITKTFWGVYLQDSHHFRDLNIQKRGLIFRIRIKNASKCNSRIKKILKKGDQNGPKFKCGSCTQEGHSALLECLSANQHFSSTDQHFPGADQHFSSANWHKLKAWPDDFWIEISLILFDFLEMRMHPNWYLII